MIRTIFPVLAISASVRGWVSAQSSTPMVAGYAATSGPRAVSWIGREADLFEKNGLRTDLIYIHSGLTLDVFAPKVQRVHWQSSADRV